MAKHVNRGMRKRGVVRKGIKAQAMMEALESRVNLSASPMFGAAPIADASIDKQVTVSADDAMESLQFGDTTVSAAGTTTINVSDYSSLTGASLEWINGVANIGYMWNNWVNLAYKTNVASGGNYNLNVGVASPYAGSFDVYVNGVFAQTYSFSSTGGWSNYSTASKSMYLGAGADTISIVPKNGAQFNMNTITLSPVGTTTTTTTTAPATSSSGNSIWVGSGGATASADQYSGIGNAKLEWQNGTPDIGYIGWGGYVEYTLNVASAGNYSIGVNTAAPWGGSFALSVNGVSAATYGFGGTGGWSSFSRQYKTVYLGAGTNVLRFATVNGSQYNTGNITISTSGSPSTTTVTPAPAPAPAPTTSTGGVVNVGTTWMQSFNELQITGTSGDDNIYVTQSGSTVTVSANGRTSSYYGPYGDIVIKGEAGNDTITVDSSVNAATLVYGDDGNDTIANATRGLATVVTIGSGYNTVSGNGFNSALWVNSGDTVNATWTETNAGQVHRVGSFWNGVSTQLWGQNLADPYGTGATTRMTNASFWGTGPTMSDVVQGQVPDCFLLGTLQTMAMTSTAKLQQLAVDLGDGTYAVQFKRGGTTTFVRVDGDLPSNGYYQNGLMYAHPGAAGTIWAAIIEKAYAEFRSNAWNYSSLSFGNFSNVLADFGVSYTNFGAMDANSLFNSISANVNRGVTVGTTGYISGGAPLVNSHTYTVTSAWRDSWGNGWVTLRNPWGFDGAGSDGNSGDALVTMTINQLQSNLAMGTILA